MDICLVCFKMAASGIHSLLEFVLLQYEMYLPQSGLSTAWFYGDVINFVFSLF